MEDEENFLFDTSPNFGVYHLFFLSFLPCFLAFFLPSMSHINLPQIPLTFLLRYSQTSNTSPHLTSTTLAPGSLLDYSNSFLVFLPAFPFAPFTFRTRVILKKPRADHIAPLLRTSQWLLPLHREKLKS